MEERVIIWTKGIENLYCGKVSPGGITLQMHMWAKVFSENGWSVYSFTSQNPEELQKADNIKFIKYPSIKFLNPVISFLFSVNTLKKIKPKLIIVRGATRDLLQLSVLSRIFGIRLIFLTASDSDLQKGKELIKRNLEKSLFRLGLHFIENFIVQNQRQASFLTNSYKKYNYLSIPNIWSFQKNNNGHVSRDIILWIGDFRKLKRPEWFIELSKAFPDKKFMMAGGGKDVSLYNKCRAEALKIPNLEFLGPVSFQETQKLFSQACLYVCTSNTEGFPNTFLQAWSNNIPVISTFDPGSFLSTKNLGIYCQNQKDLFLSIKQMSDKEIYSDFQASIRKYIAINHVPQVHYNELVEKFLVT